jgi:hypothetical protein
VVLGDFPGEYAARPEEEGPVLLSVFVAMLALLAFSAVNLALFFV